ncbi:DUF3795 domain-containing protein [Mycoplasmatota bacterium zrk1]
MYAMCGIDCSKCDYKDKMNCGGCHKQEGKMFWGECGVAKCVLSRKHTTCVECTKFPCSLLKEFAYDEEQGDNGERIENLRKLRQ